MPRTLGSSNTCHVCLASKTSADIQDCPLCEHKTCRPCMSTIEKDGSVILVCQKCDRSKRHRHPTGHHGRS